MKKTLLAVIFAVSMSGCSNDPAKFPSESANASAGGGLSKLPSPPDDMVDKSDVPERDLSVYQPGVFKLPKNAAARTTQSRPAVRAKKVTVAPKKKVVSKKTAAKKVVAKKTAAKKVVKSKKSAKSVTKKSSSKSKTAKKVTSKKSKKTRSKAR